MATAVLTSPKQFSRQSSSAHPLSELQPGDQAVIERTEGTVPVIRRRLLEMGLTHGTHIEVIRFAPLGDPIEISVRGYRLSLRKDEAAFILVRKVSP